MPFSNHNNNFMHGYSDEISVEKISLPPKRRFLSNVVAVCRTKMLVFDKFLLHLLSVCGIFDSVKAVRGVFGGNYVPLNYVKGESEYGEQDHCMRCGCGSGVSEGAVRFLEEAGGRLSDR